ncbi:MAG: hypothetical protein KJ600_04505 [Nanoarchaeota archaeon]|nr:hypothetical protein [Nanoarchaeota archaeon]MBU1103789.1 hypothetical protein [Nanoarchaeota archaeon]
MKTWLKGGLIGLGISLVGILGYFLGAAYSIMPSVGPLMVLNVPNGLLLVAISGGGWRGFGPIYFGIITAPITYFLIGALIGLVIGKIKQRKQQVNS